jgi:YD repeat-containing protein
VVVLEAHAREGVWHLCRPGSAEPVLTLLAKETETGTEPALLDPRGGIAAALTTPGPDARTMAVARDGDGRVVSVVRSDGPSGIHLVDDRGEVTALASRAGTGRQVALDVLVTRPNGDAHEALLFGILLGLELTRLGELRPV